MVLDPESPDVNREVEQAFEHGGMSLTIDSTELHKRDSGNHTATTTEYETDNGEDSDEDEFEQMRAQRMREREAAPPERDIFEDDTETADFQLKLRHMPQLPQSSSNVALAPPISSSVCTNVATVNTPAETIKEESATINIAKSVEVSADVFVGEQRIPEHPNESSAAEEGTVNEDDTDKCGEMMFPIQQSRSFESGLPPVTPELNRLMKTYSSTRSLSSKSSSVLSVMDRRSLSITTPSPRKQSIEDLASSVENLKEKLMLIPKDSAETIQAVKERLARPAQVNGQIIRSRSWQGFGAAHRTARQQAFWESGRYESNTEKDLSLPPPPEKVPDQVTKRLSRSSKSPSRYRQRGYRPLSQSPLRDSSSSPARHHLRLSHLHPSKERSSSLEGKSTADSVEQAPKLRQVQGGLQPQSEKAGSSSLNESSVDPKTAHQRFARASSVDSEASSSSDEEDLEDETYSYSVVKDPMTSGGAKNLSSIDKSTDQDSTSEEAKMMTDNMDEQSMLAQEQEFLDQSEDGQRRQKAPNQYFYRHHYLSIIQEEEEHSDLASCSSRASSRPGSIYGHMGLMGTPETSPKRGHKSRVRDSIGSEFSIDSVNSLLSEEGSCQTYSSISTNKTDEALKTLTHMLDNVPPPGSAPNVQDSLIQVKKEPIDETCKQLTTALEHQLHEIEKQVKTKQQLSSSKPVSASSQTKFGSSMREMLKSVVSSQKNVLTKKVEPIETTPTASTNGNNSSQNTSSSKSNSKVGKFFQTLAKNPLSKSNQSLAQSKESLNIEQLQFQHQTSSNSKKRSKSLTSDTRNSLSSGNRNRSGEGGHTGASSRSKWIGKSPFELDKSPNTEVSIVFC